MAELRDAAARRRAVHALDESLLVEAGAGTGKTTTMVRRIVALLTEPARPGEEPLKLGQIVAITFTERAAEELKDRLRADIFRELSHAEAERAERLSVALTELEFAPVGTIHSFCSALLRRYPIDAGVDIQYAVMDERESADLRLDVWREWIVRETRGGNPADIMGSVLDYGIGVSTIQDFAFRLLDLRANDAAASLAEMSVEPVDWTSELAALDSVVTRLESRDSDLLEEYGIRRPNASLLAKMRRLVQRIAAVDGMERHQVILAEMPFGETAKTARPVMERVTRLRERISGPVISGLADWIGGPDGFIEAYRREMSRRGAMDFDDLLIAARDLVRDHHDVCRELRSEFRTFIVDEFQDTDPVQAELICRLTQDSDAEADWSKTPISPGSLCVVGDPKQSIYRFRGANIDTYATVAGLLGSGAECLLHSNFRSHPEIIRAVNDIFKLDGMFRVSNGEDAESASYQPAYHPLEPSPRLVENDNNGGGATERRVLVLSDGEDADTHADPGRLREGRVVAATIKSMVEEGRLVRDPASGVERPMRFGDAALLYRSSSHLPPYEEALRDTGVPYYLIGGTGFYRREEIMRLVSAVTAIDQPGDAPAVVAALRSVFFGVSDSDLAETALGGGDFDYRAHSDAPLPPAIDAAFDILRDLHEMRVTTRPAAVVQALYDRTGVLNAYAQLPGGDQAIANLMKALDEVRRLETDGPVSFRRLRDGLCSLRDAQSDEGDAGFDADDPGGRVRLLTIHKAKGLEFPVVCVIDSGAAPPTGRHTSSRVIADMQALDGSRSVGARIDGEDVKLRTAGFEAVDQRDADRDAAESVRLLYVALTRARDYLLLPTVGKVSPSSWAAKIAPAIASGNWVETILVAPTDRAPEQPKAATTSIEELDRGRAELLARRERLRALADRPSVVYQRPSLHASERGSLRESPTDLGEDRADFVEDRADFGDVEAAERDVRQRIGTAVHEALERLSPGADRREIETAARRVLVECQFDPDKHTEFGEYVATVADLTDRALASELVGRAFAAKEMWREVPVTLCESSDDGMLHVTRGICDLVFREGDGLVLVDYKTDRVSGDEADLEAKTRDYTAQIRSYVRALEAATGLPVCEAWLLFLAASERAVARIVAGSNDDVRTPRDQG